MFKIGTTTGIQATKIVPSAHCQDDTGAHQEAGVLPVIL